MSLLLAIDPGATTGLIILTIGPRPKLIHHEIYKAAIRTVRPSGVVKALMEQYGIERAAIEDQFLHTQKTNPDTFKKVARRSGHWEEACLSAGIPVSWVNPRTWQTAILGDRLGRTREQIDAAMRMIAHQDTKIKLSSDESAAWCIGRYVAEEIYRGRVHAEYGSQRKTHRKSKKLGKSSRNGKGLSGAPAEVPRLQRAGSGDKTRLLLPGLLP